MSLHLYSTGYPDRLPAATVQALADRLPAALGQKAMRFLKWQDAYGSLFGKHLLRVALQKAGHPGDLIQLQTTSHGRPFLKNGPEFNISHSGNRVVCILSTQGRVGIDLEETADLHFSDFQAQFTAKEWTDITQAAAPLLLFYHYWTAKESLIKADGRGLSIPLDQLEIGDSSVVKVNDDIWFIRKLTLFPGYVCHVACENPIGILKVEEISPGMF
jgi:4'-phosphopantetheinyl transferase